jgi:hypothetical protein
LQIICRNDQWREISRIFEYFHFPNHENFAYFGPETINMNYSVRLTASLCLLLFLAACSKDKKSNCETVDITATVVSSDAANGSITATATGGSGFTYSIDGTNFAATGSFTALAPGAYTITAKNSNGCTGSKSFTVGGTKKYYLTRSTWKFSSAKAGLTDISSSLQTCQKDNILTFAAAGTGTNDEGATKCAPGDPQSTPFTWNFAAAETQLFISSTLFTGGNNTFNIVTLSNTQMILSQTITVGGLPLSVEVTFIH